MWWRRFLCILHRSGISKQRTQSRASWVTLLCWPVLTMAVLPHHRYHGHLLRPYCAQCISVALTRNENEAQTLPSCLLVIWWQTKKYTHLMRASESWSHRCREDGCGAGTWASPELCWKSHLLNILRCLFFCFFFSQQNHSDSLLEDASKPIYLV